MTRESIFAKYPVDEACGMPIRQAWVETLQLDGEKQTDEARELVPLHPDIWSVRPRIDEIKDNVEWQLLHKKVTD